MSIQVGWLAVATETWRKPTGCNGNADATAAYGRARFCASTDRKATEARPGYKKYQGLLIIANIDRPCHTPLSASQRLVSFCWLLN